MKNFAKRAILVSALLLWTAFIFSNSLQSGEASNAQSESVKDAANTLLVWLGGEGLLVGGFIRTLAHFAEFCLLGALLALLPHTFDIQKKHAYVFALLAAFAVAIIDECIQSLVPGRTPSISDVLVDFAGSTTGVAFVLLCLFLYMRCKEAKQQRK